MKLYGRRSGGGYRISWGKTTLKTRQTIMTMETGKLTAYLHLFLSFSKSKPPSLMPISAAEQLLQHPFPTSPISSGSHRCSFPNHSPHCFIPDPNSSKHSLGTPGHSFQGSMEANCRSSLLPLFLHVQSLHLKSISIADLLLGPLLISCSHSLGTMQSGILCFPPFC